MAERTLAKKMGEEVERTMAETGMVTEKVDEEINEEGANVDTNNPAEVVEEERLGTHSPCNSNYA
ncbi:hypothetical protein H5410_019018 [Solanum commersonii]|uniref:Uncharacterized protein n=1 Tax=Solanum commersonii TaxID=4109 RepID=A0A9J6A4C5_SOLCO|nr:hypothetical protein H5410_019018 [Solanum commersonii]